jgi:hypothetical protein
MADPVPTWAEPTPPQWPPIETAPVPPSAPGVPQPEFASGSATSPAPPINITGSPILPPPLITNPPPPEFPPVPPDTAPVPVPLGPLVGPAIAPAGVPPSVAGIAQPVFRTGSATAPPATSWFPDFSVPILVPAVAVDNELMIGTAPPQVVNPALPILPMGGWGPWFPTEPAPWSEGATAEPANSGNGRRRRRKPV